jgi:phage anti-repressor protein
MSTQYKLAKAYSAKLGESLTVVNLEEFFHTVRKEFYVDINVDFMEFFIELTGSEDYDIHHTKLIEYGIMTSSKSDHIKEKFENSGLVEGVDFILKESEQSVNSGVKYSKDYYLNVDSFKLCLLTAQRRPGQEVDPFIYSDYYILLERIYILYTYYQRTYNAKLISIKDELISINEKIISINEELISRKKSS